jgi:hypothetical protein
MVPAAHEPGFGRREPRPQTRSRERLSPVDLGRAIDLDQLVLADLQRLDQLAHATTSIR